MGEKFDNFWSSGSSAQNMDLMTPNGIAEHRFEQMQDIGNRYDGLVGIPGFFKKLFGYDVEAERNARVAAANQEYERQSIDSARAWSEYMDNTTYQRRVKDLEAAGLNPWLAVQNGISGTGAPSVDTGGTAQQGMNTSNQSSGILRALLMMVVAFATKNPSAAKAAAAGATSNKVWSMMSKKI